jgi:hypothetical protein
MISLEATKEFQDIWKEEFGEDIPADLALEEGLNLLTIIDAIYRPIKQEWFDEYENKNEYGTHIKEIKAPEYNGGSTTKNQKKEVLH